MNWRNPRIHSIDRVKVWLACDEHRDYLREYLDTRGFPVVVTPLGTEVTSVGSPGDTPGATIASTTASPTSDTIGETS